MQDNMSMTLYWSVQCSFIFQSWTTENTLPFIIACIICSVFAALSLLLSPLRQTLERIMFTNLEANNFRDQQSQRDCKVKQTKDSIITNRVSHHAPQIQKSSKYSLFLFIYYLVFSTQHVSLMLLIMTMNGYVIIAILIGLTIGYYFSLHHMAPQSKNTQDSGSPVNCCVHD